jgi:hypothetical protein
MAEVSGLIALNKFVRKTMFKMKKENDNFFRYLTVAQDGLSHLFMHKMGYITATKLTVGTDTNTIDFPADYVHYISLSIPDDGRMWTLTRDDDLVTTTSTDDDGEYLDDDYGEGFDLSEEYIPLGYGARGGFNDTYYTIDHKNRRFVIAGTNPSHIILRYVSSGINDGAETYLPKYAEMPLEKYMMWQLSEYDNEHRTVTADKKRAFESAIRQMRKFLAPTLDELKDAIFRTQNQSVRR